MSCGTCGDQRHERKSDHLVRDVLIVLYALFGVCLPIYLHVFLNYSPWVMAPVFLILAHLVVFGVIAIVTGRLVRGGSDHPHSNSQADPPEALILRPRLYDRFLRVATLGQEKRFRRRILALAQLKPGDSVLDVGCGTGTLLLLAAPAVGATGKLHGAEPSRPMVEHARSKAVRASLAIDVCEAPATALPYPAAMFDVVFCTMVLHHLPETQRADAVAEMYRVLKPGGRVVIADVARPRTFRAIFSIVSLAHLRAPHRVMDASDVRALMTSAGFTTIDQCSLGQAVGVAVATRAW